jgi:hypothetical protein
MRKALTVSIIITFVAVVAYISKPTETRCLQEVRKVYKTQGLSYTTQALPPNINPEVLRQTAEKAFMETVEIKDRYLFRDILQLKGNTNTKIGWAAFGWVQVGIN